MAVSSQEASDKADTAGEEKDYAQTQLASSGKPSSHHAFRLSFSPTGIPTVEATQHLGAPVPSVDSQQLDADMSTLDPSQQLSTEAVTLHPTQQLGTQASTLEFPQQLGTQASIAEPTQQMGTRASTLESTQQLGTQASILEPTQHLGTHTVHHNGSSASSPATSSRRWQPTKDPHSQGITPMPAAMPQAATCNAAPADSIPLVGIASEERPSGASKVEQTHGVRADPLVQSGADQSKAQSCTPSGLPPHPMLPPPSTPMLAWLDALSTPESTLLVTPDPPGGGVATAGSEHLLLGSTARALGNESAPGLLAASPEAVPEALRPVGASPPPLTDACSELLPQSGPTLLPPPNAVSGKGAIAVAVTDPGPDQAAPGPVPHQATPAVAESYHRSLPATPGGWPRQATPHLGPPTGLSGLTTPASAAEMHRYAS